MKDVPYSSAVGSLMYAQVCTRLDIAFAISVLGRFLNNPGVHHWTTAKIVMRYLQRTKDFMLTYRRSGLLEVVGYADANFAGCSDDLKSLQDLCSCWLVEPYCGRVSSRHLQLHLLYKLSMWHIMMQLFKQSGCGIKFSGSQIVDLIYNPMTIYCDNSAAVCFSKNNERSSGSKHIEIEYLVVREKF